MRSSDLLRQNWLGILAVLLCCLNLFLLLWIKDQLNETYWTAKATSERIRVALPTELDLIVDDAIRTMKSHPKK